MSSVQLFTSRATNGSSNYFDHWGDDLIIWVWGTLGGASVSVEIETPDGSAWVGMEGGTWTASGAKVLRMPASRIRLTVTSASGTTSINSAVRRQ